MAKKVTYSEKYKKGLMIEPETCSNLIKKHSDTVSIELRERKTYSDGTESIIVEINV